MSLPNSFILVGERRYGKLGSYMKALADISVSTHTISLNEYNECMSLLERKLNGPGLRGYQDQTLEKLAMIANLLHLLTQNRVDIQQKLSKHPYNNHRM